MVLHLHCPANISSLSLSLTGLQGFIFSAKQLIEESVDNEGEVLFHCSQWQPISWLCHYLKRFLCVPGGYDYLEKGFYHVFICLRKILDESEEGAKEKCQQCARQTRIHCTHLCVCWWMGLSSDLRTDPTAYSKKCEIGSIICVLRFFNQLLTHVMKEINKMTWLMWFDMCQFDRSGSACGCIADQRQRITVVSFHKFGLEVTSGYWSY